jgi:hypothetical protein
LVLAAFRRADFVLAAGTAIRAEDIAGTAEGTVVVVGVAFLLAASVGTARKADAKVACAASLALVSKLLIS